MSSWFYVLVKPQKNSISEVDSLKLWELCKCRNDSPGTVQCQHLLSVATSSVDKIMTNEVYVMSSLLQSPISFDLDCVGLDCIFSSEYRENEHFWSRQIRHASKIPCHWQIYTLNRSSKVSLLYLIRKYHYVAMNYIQDCSDQMTMNIFSQTSK